MLQQFQHDTDCNFVTSFGAAAGPSRSLWSHWTREPIRQNDLVVDCVEKARPVLVIALGIKVTVEEDAFFCTALRRCARNNEETSQRMKGGRLVARCCSEANDIRVRSAGWSKRGYLTRLEEPIVGHASH